MSSYGKFIHLSYECLGELSLEKLVILHNHSGIMVKYGKDLQNLSFFILASLNMIICFIFLVHSFFFPHQSFELLLVYIMHSKKTKLA